MISISEYKAILKRYGVEVKIYDDVVVSGEIEREMIKNLLIEQKMEKIKDMCGDD